jgi:hypothetical protein
MAATLDRAFLPSPVSLPVAPAQAATRVEETKAATEQLVSHGFSDNMEWAMTGLVLTGVLMFGAGMLHFAVPACTARDAGVLGLYIMAGATAAATLFAACRGVWHLVRR